MILSLISEVCSVLYTLKNLGLLEKYLLLPCMMCCEVDDSALPHISLISSVSQALFVTSQVGA